MMTIIPGLSGKPIEAVVAPTDSSRKRKGKETKEAKPAKRMRPLEKLEQQFTP
jgi:hypothetical protein